MKFKQIHRILILTFVLCFKIIRGDNSEAKKWHIIDGLLYYIELEQKYSALDAALFCKSIGMVKDLFVYPEIIKYLRDFYGNFPPLRLVVFSGCESHESSYVLNGWMKNEMPIYFGKCSEKYGFICSTNILNGEIQFKNGTQLSINRDDVIKYCDPQAEHAFDQQNCMIIFRP